MKRKSVKVKATNLSDWPTPLLEVLSKFVAKELGVTWSYRIEFRRPRRNAHWSGRCHSSSFCRVRVDLRWSIKSFPRKMGYYRYAWTPLYDRFNKLEILVHLIAHEMYHSWISFNGDYQWNNNGRHNVAGEEMKCDRMAEGVVSKFREERSRLITKIRKQIVTFNRKQRSRRESRQDRKSPQYKLNLAQTNLENWQKKLKYAENKIRTYRRKIKYYERRMAI